MDILVVRKWSEELLKLTLALLLCLKHPILSLYVFEELFSQCMFSEVVYVIGSKSL